MIALLLEACPSAEASWSAHVEHWGSESRGDFNDLGVFAHHVVERFGAGATPELGAFFQLLEAFLSSLDPQTVGLAKYGLVETIQTVASHQAHGYQVLEQWCLPETVRAWSDVQAEWAGKGSLAEVVCAERKSVS